MIPECFPADRSRRALLPCFMEACLEMPMNADLRRKTDDLCSRLTQLRDSL